MVKSEKISIKIHKSTPYSIVHVTRRCRNFVFRNGIQIYENCMTENTQYKQLNFKRKF